MKIIGYGLITNSTSPADADTSNSKTRQDIKLLGGDELDDKDIYIDIRRKRSYYARTLPKVISQLKQGDILIIPTIASLGKDNQERYDNYTFLYKNGIKLRTKDEYNTDGKKLSKAEFEKLANQIANMEKVPTNAGRLKDTTPMPEKFPEMYWLYENYFISEKALLNNKYFSISKRKCYRYAAEYEATEDYKKRLAEEIQKNGIDTKPKRFGPTPNSIEKNKNLSAEEKRRYIMRRDGGKSAMATAANTYKDEAIIRSVVAK